MNSHNNPLAELNQDFQTSQKESTGTLEIICNYLSKILFSYLPLVVYIIVNVPCLKESMNPCDNQLFIKNMFLALTYVFISQINSLSLQKDSFANLIFAGRLFCGIFCIALFATSKFNLNYYWFGCFLLISFLTLFFTTKIESKEKF